MQGPMKETYTTIGGTKRMVWLDYGEQEGAQQWTKSKRRVGAREDHEGYVKILCFYFNINVNLVKSFFVFCFVCNFLLLLFWLQSALQPEKIILTS